MVEEISVMIKSLTWTRESREKLLKFREWIEAKGGKWTEPGARTSYTSITFKPIKKTTKVSSKSTVAEDAKI